ncbi:hypothetical protein POREN0001_0774 [Porphyromonas endodontalis ATCC 35406]|uniref:Transmembrane protein n=1 Tax=Porphyromonas endodontalis (strain ATCC 35406 / DSM 24491 / JCM 8526 / CCUG 16442 / BCRC 14492 / NCTC 13058 / HG 370) TaxID=553175 RepID=C3J9M3_POREA|nr:hypothetical protein POREN0001_0774 [Porphyromonas endodontalis ATCC 35406]
MFRAETEKVLPCGFFSIRLIRFLSTICTAFYVPFGQKTIAIFVAYNCKRRKQCRNPEEYY